MRPVATTGTTGPSTWVVHSRTGRTLEFRTSSYRSGIVGLLVACGLIVTIGALIDQLSRLAYAPLAFGIGVAALLLLAGLSAVLYWTIATLRLRYRLDRNGIKISWGGSHLIVPLRNVQIIAPVGRLEENLELTAASQRRGWLGGWAGRARLSDGRVAVLRSSGPPESRLAILTSTRAYIVSPDRPDAFVQAWQERRPLGPTRNWREEEQRTWPLGLPIWRDRVTWGLLGGMLVSALVMYGAMALVYERLPDRLALHFDALGQPDRIGQRGEVLRLPVIALMLLVIDLALGFALYRRDRVATYLIWAGGILLQLLVWGALYTIAR